MISLLDANQDGKDVRIVISKNLNFLLYIYRFYDHREDNLSEYQALSSINQGMISTAFFHLRGITLWNQMIYALGDAELPIEADENNWYEDSYDYETLFSELDTYQKVREAFTNWWDNTGFERLTKMEAQIQDVLKDFPIDALDSDHFLMIPVFDQMAESLTWGNETIAIFTPHDIIAPAKMKEHLTFMSK